MNIANLNTISLDGKSLIIKKGGGGGNSGGGGDTPSMPDMPIIGDGKTYLYIDINPKYENGTRIELFYRGDTYEKNALTIDWGDGNKETKDCDSYTNYQIQHTYSKSGKYIISLDIKDGVVLTLGNPTSYYGILGSAGSYAYGGIVLTALELGKNIELGNFSVQSCYSLSNVVLGEYIQELTGFMNCYSLASIVIPNSVTSIYGFSYCYSLRNVVVGNGVNTIKSKTFRDCNCLYSIDFSSSLSIPTLENTDSMPPQRKNLSIIVPDALYDGWISATNWSSFAKNIIKKSDWDAQNA